MVKNFVKSFKSDASKRLVSKISVILLMEINKTTKYQVLSLKNVTSENFIHFSHGANTNIQPKDQNHAIWGF